MDFDQESKLVLSVLRAQHDQWHVTAHDVPQPLVSFDSPHEACAWAIARAIPERGRVFVEGHLIDYSGFAADPKNGRTPPTQHRDFLLPRRTGAG